MTPSAHLTSEFAREFATLGPDPAKLAAWAAALRSGKHRQTFGAFTRDGEYCSIGLARRFGYLDRSLSSAYCQHFTLANDNERLTFPQIADFLDTVIALCGERG